MIIAPYIAMQMNSQPITSGVGSQRPQVRRLPFVTVRHVFRERARQFRIRHEDTERADPP